MKVINRFIYSHVIIGLCAVMFLLGIQSMAFATEGKLDLNTATAKELQTLPNIGKDLAKRIVEYREDHGPFKTVEELMNVKGIGKGILAKVKDFLMIEETPQSSETK